MGVLMITPLLLLVLLHLGSPNDVKEPIRQALVHSWAQKLGVELWNCGDLVTRRNEVQESYKAAQVEGRDGAQLVQEIAADIKYMMESKISAVKRIMDSAETTAMSHKEQNLTNYEFYDAKNITQPGENMTYSKQEMILTPNVHFYNIAVNTTFSAVHVPTNVFGGEKKILNAIKWSEQLDRIFTSNYNMDPSLSWQYFGSSLGFMRQYPAVEWPLFEKVDIYDCRTRSWYIEAANSPKDIIILVDNSGSMTGIKKEIARHVVNNILDTLGNNDFVNVFNFSENITEVVTCFRETLVQANLANIRELKKGMENLLTDKIANFSLALNKAFDILEMYREERVGACCNQAIMLVTDGAPYNYKEIFEKYNWRDRPNMPVRVFTYLIGREIADVREVKWMACANRGWFVHLSTLAEVREKVLSYVPVMSRPMVLWRKEHPTIWTPVYADTEDPKKTDWLWEIEECAEQKEVIADYRSTAIKKFISQEEKDKRYVRKLKRFQNQFGDLQKYTLMTSVSMPVFDRSENANITERIMINEAIWVEKTRESRIANLLGVAGTDVPIDDFKKLMMPHLLGVNAYAFMVTNNGYILIHPDLRPVFQGILKPSYNSVDMAEVELMDDDNEARDMNPDLLAFRDAVINQSSGTTLLKVKYHYDRMKRVSRMTRRYYYHGIEKTPFTLVISIPEPYGTFRVNAIEEIGMHRSHVKGTNIKEHLSGTNWKIHPDWVYCKYRYDAEHQYPSPESELKHFLEKSLQPGWRWPLNRTFPPPELVANASMGKTEKFDKDSYYCDRKLFLSLIFDAKVTEWFSRNFSSSKEEKGKEFKQRFGITVTFIATHSGLTRWFDFTANDDSNEPHFSELYNRAIDEIWYKRAVEQHFIDAESFVYSVPFDASEKENNLVTASHAVFHTYNNRKAPAAVVGLQFQHSALHAHFINITYSCNEISNCDKSKTCESDNLACYVLDNHGYIIVSESLNDTGLFFGEVKGSVMEMMVKERIYKKIHMFDYQAVCFEGDQTISLASFMLTPLTHLKWLIEWAIGNLIWSLVQIGLPQVWFGDISYAAEPEGEELTYDEEPEPPPEETNGHSNKQKEKILFKELMINRTRPTPCDMEMDLYRIEDKGFDKERRETSCSRPFAVQSIPHSNLLLVVVYTLCGHAEQKVSVNPVTVNYNGSSLSCYKQNTNILSRKRPKDCINQHPDESKIDLCGAGTGSTIQWIPALWVLTAGIAMKM